MSAYSAFTILFFSVSYRKSENGMVKGLVYLFEAVFDEPSRLKGWF